MDHDTPQKTVTTEFIEVVDSSNRPLAVMSRLEAHRQGLYHRSVVVLAYNQDHKLLIQKRHSRKTLYPGRWDLSATGHVLAGESCMDAALREMKEEVGITHPKLRLITSIKGSQQTGYEFINLYSAGKTREIPCPNPIEVEDTMFVEKDEMGLMVREFPDILTPGTVYFWQKQLLFPKL